MFNAVDRIADTLGLSAQDIADDMRRIADAMR